MNLYTHKCLRRREYKVLSMIFMLVTIIAGVIGLIGLGYVLFKKKEGGTDGYIIVGIIGIFVVFFCEFDSISRFYGDKMRDGKIIYYKFFRKHILTITEIPIIVISARLGGYWGMTGTMRECSDGKKSMPCISILKKISDYKTEYFYMENIKDGEAGDFLYSFNGTKETLSEFFRNRFNGETYILDRIYNENKTFFEYLEALSKKKFFIYHANEPIKERFY